MKPVRTLVMSKEIATDPGIFTLTLFREDFSLLYPGMERFELTVSFKGRTLDVFRTNTYEYTPLEPLLTESVVQKKAVEWELEIHTHPEEFVSNHHVPVKKQKEKPRADLVIIQGSPRPDGNCGLLALWAQQTAQEMGRTARVIYPHDLDIHCCIGCYQCYNTGTCVFDDDMTDVIDAIRSASLIVVCSPVYTNTVPGGLKLLIDRTQAYHAERMITEEKTGQKGIVVAVAGRRGMDNFTCVTRVISSFLENIGIKPAGQILVDRADAVRDIRTRPGIKDLVRETVRCNLV